MLSHLTANPLLKERDGMAAETVTGYLKAHLFDSIMEMRTFSKDYPADYADLKAQAALEIAAA
jgi:hypothetical protein